MGLVAFKYFKPFSDEISGQVNKYVFLILYRKCVNIWKLYVTQGISPFQMADTWCYNIIRCRDQGILME